MAFDKPYDIDPSPTGDTVKEAVGKNELNIDDIYDNLNNLLAQIGLVPNTPQGMVTWLLDADGSGSELDADKLDGFHASAFSQTTHSHPDATQSVSGFLSATDKQKLDDIAGGAEVNVQSDWDVNNSSEDAFIRNKPKVSLVEGAPLDGDICLFTGPMTMRGATPTEMHSILEYFKQNEFISQTTGVPDAGKPIILGADGLLDASLMPAILAEIDQLKQRVTALGG